jgi:hypothetical protein
MPVYISNSEDRAEVPEGWSTVEDINGAPLEREFDSGFYTAYSKVMQEDEPVEVIISTDDPESQIVGQILSYAFLPAYGTGGYGTGEYGTGESGGTAAVVGVFGSLDSPIEGAAGSPGESPGESGSWLVQTIEALNLQAQDSLLVVNTTNQENEFFNDLLAEESPGDALEFDSVSEIDSVFTEIVTFRTASSGILSGVTTTTVQHFADLLVPDTGVLMLLRIRGLDSSDERLPFTEHQVLDAEKSDSEIYGLREGVSQDLVDFDTYEIFEDAVPFINEFSIVFNESRKSPGFNITLRGLLEFDEIEVIRRDPTGRYPDENVRGLTRQVTSDDELFITDYEAPLNAVVHYYIRLVNEGGEFFFGPVLPTPQPFIPTLDDAYAGGTAFLKPIDLPEIGQSIAIENMETWTRPANILAKHHVLGRRNAVVISDIRGGREGSFTGHCILHWGQPNDVLEAALDPGSTILLQNHNATVSAFPDMYVNIQDVSFTRRTRMVRHGELSNVGVPEVVVTFECSYVQVDRPDPSGVEIPASVWQVVYDTFRDFEEVRATRATWLDVLARPIGPGGPDSGESS